MRAPEPEDLDFIYELENDRDNWVYGDTHQEISKAVLKRWLFQGVDVYESKHLRLLACQDKEPAACVDLLNIDFFHQMAYVAVITQKEYREKGLAEYALNGISERAKNDLGLRNIFAEVSNSNEASKRLFTKCGFKVIGKKVNARKEMGNWVDLLIFQRELV